MKIVVEVKWNPNHKQKVPRTIGARIQRQRVLEQVVRNAVGSALFEHTDVQWRIEAEEVNGR